MTLRARHRTARVAAGVALALLAAACGRDASDGERAASSALPSMLSRGTNADARPPAVPFDPATPRVLARARASVPHDTGAYTQGLVVHGGRLLEAVGRKGLSDVRDVDRVTGSVVRRTALPPEDFGEGIAAVGDRLYQLTWTGGRGYVYDAASLARVDSFTFAGEGWGLASDGRSLYLSDGTSHVRVVDPAGFRVLRTFQVREAGQPVWMLNELEWVRGELWANVYGTSLIARVDPADGHVVGWVDAGALLTPAERSDVADRGGVANGIAYDSTRATVLLTGKLWPRVFEVDAASVAPPR